MFNIHPAIDGWFTFWMHPAVDGWFTFWMIYWLAESLFPFDEKSKEIQPSASVPKTVAKNMFYSLPYSLILWELVPDFSVYIPGHYIVRFIISAVIMDGWFYLIHRLLHHRYFYRWHKQHHQYHTPYPLVAVYASPIEALLCDVTSVGLGPVLLKMTGLELEIWMCLMALHALLIHSSACHGREHNIHHGKNIGNYGLLSLFDHIFGTYQ